MNDDTGNAERPPTGAEGRSPFHHRKRPEGAASSLAAAAAEPGARRVPVGSRGRVAIIDAADYERVSRYRWWPLNTPSGVYARGYVDGRRILLHRFILDAPATTLVDHRNGDRLDCRRSNLRPATSAQNRANSGPRGGASRYKGVIRTRSGKWEAAAKKGGRRYYLGTYVDEAAAARAYDAAARVEFGEFAVLNFAEVRK